MMALQARRLEMKKVPPSELPMLPGELGGDFWQACGMSRDGKHITCGHKHRTEAAADKCDKCVFQMKKARPGNCQTYRAQHIYLVIRRKK